MALSIVTPVFSSTWYLLWFIFLDSLRLWSLAQRHACGNSLDARSARPLLLFSRCIRFVFYQASPSLAGGNGLSLSVRDLLSWTGFITSSLAVGDSDIDTSPSRLVNTSGCASDDSITGTEKVTALRPWEAYVHGASLVLLDGMGLGSGLSVTSIRRLRAACAVKLAEQVRESGLFQRSQCLFVYDDEWEHLISTQGREPFSGSCAPLCR